MKRNTLFGAAAMLMAGAAIGAGAVITQNAMADDGTAQPADTLTMVNIDADGNAVSCTFTGDDVAGLVPPGIPTDDVAKQAAIDGQVVVGQASVIATAEGDLPAIDISNVTGGSLPPGTGQGVVTVQADATAAGVVSIDGAVGEAREGTAEECQAMRDQALADLQNLQGQVAEASGSLVVSGSGDVTVSTKP